MKTISYDLTAIEEKAQEVAAQYLTFQQDLESEARNIRKLVCKDVNALTLRLKYIDKLIARLLKEAHLNPDAFVAYKNEVREAEGKTWERDAQFNKNAQCQVKMYPSRKTNVLSSEVLDVLEGVMILTRERFLKNMEILI